MQPVRPADWGPFDNAWRAFSNDLNTPAALGALFNGLKKARGTAGSAGQAQQFLQGAGALVYALGLQLFVRKDEDSEQLEVPPEVEELARQRWEAKRGKNFAEADRLRDEISGQGWLVVDTPDGYSLNPKS